MYTIIKAAYLAPIEHWLHCRWGIPCPDLLIGGALHFSSSRRINTMKEMVRVESKAIYSQFFPVIHAHKLFWPHVELYLQCACYGEGMQILSQSLLLKESIWK